ncbi:Transcriptional activator HlyU [bioreactor metagenome]|uniref:Transcriptional activator HlyU n=1 Tax=bioreactor metagenome TaxID=1076179 RepID=A0A644T5N6_9ZZZZ|nr:metalloregulator ArsR/SmtB family transcription factor [Candidatus Elulimicrobiales bacterium]
MIDQKTCKAIGNKERLGLILCLEKEKTVNDLLELCQLSQSALSQHLKILRDNKIVSTRREGKQIFYKTKDKKFITIGKLLSKN